ncbi:peroxisome biogenesis factor 2-like [Varroa jacobsoni]|uniref:Peroxisome biogenesis factor 2 n=1 Tax=Varroa destructor TaxID=109461 RepID=A0A7M7JSG0_VARDE|nr:peroxisome biogenesis factor 2-like [Varroa destructor]XP_022695344.1 peroxisome biogenesis factor 2-like [Varroa jacobsoni]
MAVSKLIGSRVDQLDAFELDDQLFTILKNQLTGAFKYFERSQFLALWSLEVDAIIKASLFSVLLLQNQPATVGQSLLDLSMLDRSGKPLMKWKLWSMLLLLAGTQWFRERFLISILNIVIRDQIRAERCATVIDGIIRLAGVANFYAFITQNHYPSLLYRLFGIKLYHSRPPSMRQPDYETLSRELLWTSFAEFLAFLLPIISSSGSRSFFRNALRKLYGKREQSRASLIQERSLADYKTCGICSKLPTQPHEIGCRHVYCYYCVASNVLSDEKFECPQCGFEAQGIRNVRPATLL